ncbi:MAG: ASKHA domain-containing protein [Coriobacteriia bacterium]|nr:ASKHA domain-containing protein [Coriobacteriia bacterium]
MEDVLVRFESSRREVEVPSGTTIHEAATTAGVTIATPCGGLGRCGSCRVHATGGLRSPGPAEREALGAAVLTGARLACKARVEGPGDVLVRVEAAGAMRVLTSGVGRTYVVEAPSERGLTCAPGIRPLGVAIDIGTTTIAVRLLDLVSGEVLGETGAANPQSAWGHDVLTRVSHGLAGEADTLRDVVCREIERLVSEIANTPALSDGSVCEAVIVGNPTMTHLFLGVDLTPLATAEAVGSLVAAVELDAASAGLPSLADARVHVGPAVSGFVGADAVAGALAIDIMGRTHGVLFADLGTNGEVLLAAEGRLLASSAAAGPAFEGGGVSSGMRAESGAIERVWEVGGSLGHSTIGDAPARGLCGSGLLDLVAVLLEAGAIDEGGRMQATGPLGHLVRETPEGRVFDVTHDVALTQQDVRQVQLAKAAVEVAIEVLLAETGLGYDDVREVVVAGGFGAGLRPSALVRLGVLPATWAERVTFAGNAALDGASAMLLSSAARAEAGRIATAALTVPLAERFDFQARFLASLEFPPGDV